MTITVASYLPESIIINIGSMFSLIDDKGKPAAFPTAESIGIFLYENGYYIHSVSTISGIGVVLTLLNSGVGLGGRMTGMVVAPGRSSHSTMIGIR